ncbi:MAG TPA: L-rhamnose mutarotase [Burkholderiaceae bacterium]|jgi:L-rhamnose mutarotase
MKTCLFLDLADDPELIEQYEARHRAVPAEVQGFLREQGVIGMEIYRLGTRLVMCMETDDARFDAARFAAAGAAHPGIRAWEALMWKFQRPTPWTPAGEKWTASRSIFRLDQ